ncbi:hypothetical protein NE237_022207 [Protea cynaroides]|uniref:Uncharacterized protein n=1 Tax=Protea cynaroides TaxID=273540 RepID=A0A9Q0K5K8_9MAGN|nr:hypothetical protein NE237_022207 [Protea cynaroides]
MDIPWLFLSAEKSTGHEALIVIVLLIGAGGGCYVKNSCCCFAFYSRRAGLAKNKHVCLSIIVFPGEVSGDLLPPLPISKSRRNQRRNSTSLGIESITTKVDGIPNIISRFDY